MSGEEFWDEPTGGRAEVSGGRYRLPDPVTGEVRTWTRASNVGAAVANRWALERHQRRQLVRGLAARPDLLDLLRASVELDDGKCDEVWTTALEVAGSTVKANLGTVIHEVQRRVDLGLEVPEGMERYAEGYRAALSRAGLTVVAVEVLVVNTPLGAAGRGDRIYQEADGSLVIGDTKSTAHLELAQYEIAPQLATYAGADYLDSRGLVGEHARFTEGDMPERPAWVPAADYRVRSDYALAVHVDRESGAVALYRVDLRLGGYAANLAQQVRAWPTTKGVLLPYVPPVGAAPGSVPGRHLAAVPSTFLAAAQDEVDAMNAATVKALEAVATAHDAVPPRGADSVSGPVSEAMVGGALPLKTEGELLRMTKAQVQQYGRERGVTDLAHNKPQLMPIFARAGIVAEPDRTAFTTGRVTGKPAGRSAQDPAELPAGAVGNGEDPTDPRTDAFRRARLAEVAAASTVADLWRINREVVRRGGDQAWTAEMTEAARVRVEHLDAQHGATLPTDLVACSTPQDVADLWDRVTVGGSVPGRWTEELHQLASARLEEIRAATPPAPANPFAGQ